VSFGTNEVVMQMRGCLKLQLLLAFLFPRVWRKTFARISDYIEDESGIDLDEEDYDRLDFLSTDLVYRQ